MQRRSVLCIRAKIGDIAIIERYEGSDAGAAVLFVWAPASRGYICRGTACEVHSMNDSTDWNKGLPILPPTMNERVCVLSSADYVL